MVVDELLENLQSTDREGSMPGDQKCPAMAFSDDLILMDDCEDELALSLAKAERFFALRGMEINPHKSIVVVAVFTKSRIIYRSKPIY